MKHKMLLKSSNLNAVLNLGTSVNKLLYITAYRIVLSQDRTLWHTAADVRGCEALIHLAVWSLLV